LRTVRGAGRYVERPCFPPALEALGLLNDAAKPVGVARA
jgi:dihydropyrimidinase